MDEPRPKTLSRRDFLKAAGAALGGVALGGAAAALGGAVRPDAQLVSTAPKGKQSVGKKDETVVDPEKPKQPRDAKLEDLLGEGYRQVGVTQGEGQEYPPQDVENGPGFFVSSKMEGMDLPVLDQEGPFYRYKGYKGEATQGGTVVGEGGGVTVVDSPDKFGRGASVFSSMNLGSNREGRQVLQISVDNASYMYNDDGTLNTDLTLVPERAVVDVYGKSGRATLMLDKGGAKGDIGWQFLVPLNGFRPQLEEGVNGRNILPGVTDGYRAVERVSIRLEQGQKNLTFSFEKKGKPEPKKEG